MKQRYFCYICIFWIKLALEKKQICKNKKGTLWYIGKSKPLVQILQQLCLHSYFLCAVIIIFCIERDEHLHSYMRLENNDIKHSIFHSIVFKNHFIIFYNLYFLYLIVCICMSMYGLVHMSAVPMEARRAQIPWSWNCKSSKPADMVLGTEHISFARSLCTLSFCAILSVFDSP